MTGKVSVDLPQVFRRRAAVHQGVANGEVSFHPELAEQSSLVYEFEDTGNITSSHVFRETFFVAPEDANILGRERVQKKGE